MNGFSNFIDTVRSAVSDGQTALQQEEELRLQAVAALAEQEESADLIRYEAVLAGIPDCIKSHFAAGRTYGAVMRLRFDESTEDSRWLNNYWENRRPDPDKLLKTAARVFAYCQEHGLRPYLGRAYDYDVQCFFLYLCVESSDHVSAQDTVF